MPDMRMPTDAGSREEWFLARLADETIATDTLIRAIESLRREGQEQQANSWSELLQDALIERQLVADSLRLLQVRAAWGPCTVTALRGWGQVADRTLEHMHEQRKLVSHAGFDKSVPPVEAVRRLLLLLALKADVLCLEKTWGFGIVRKVDTFYARVEIDFEKKLAHQMSLAYAAEALQLLGEDHLLARAHRLPEEVKALATGNPGELVRMALRSFGPLTVQQLQDVLVPRIVAEADWKKVWDGARKALKKDNLVEIPAKRAEPIRLLEREKAYDDAWFAALAAERDMATVLALVEELQQNGGVPDNPEYRRIVGERLAFVVKGAGRREPSLLAQAVMAAHRIGVDAEAVDAPGLAAQMLEDGFFLDVTRALPARHIAPLLDFLAGADREKLNALLLRQMANVYMTTLNEAVSYLLVNGFEEQVAAKFREAVSSQKIEVEYLYWIVRNLDKLVAWSLGTLPAVVRLLLLEMNKGYSGERLKVKNLLRSRFEQVDFLKEALGQMTPLQREEVILFVKDSSGWTTLDRQSVLGQIIKLYPELQRTLVSGTATSETTTRARLTSRRSHVERQKQLEKLVTVEIPQNSKEIAIARSYGDLSENHEFKAAKEMQGILLKRRGDLEEMLQSVKPTDFGGLPTDSAGMGTGVLLEYADGRKERYHILGEWDQDAALGIISSDTRMARALEGHKAGEMVQVPTESGDVECRIVEVTPLPPEVLRWADEVT